MADNVLDLTEIQDPAFEIRLPDGSTKSYCPFKLGDAIDVAIRAMMNDSGQLSDAQAADTMRGVMGFPNEATALEKGAFTPSIYQVLTIVGKLREMREGLDAVKKLGGPTPS